MKIIKLKSPSITLPSGDELSSVVTKKSAYDATDATTAAYVMALDRFSLKRVEVRDVPNPKRKLDTKIIIMCMCIQPLSMSNSE